MIADEDDLDELLDDPDSGSEVRIRRDARRQRTALPKLVVVLAIVAALLGTGIYGVGKVVGRLGGEPAPDYSGSGEGFALIQVPNGASATEIGNRLVKADVVASVTTFINAANANPDSRSIQPGTYRLRTKMSAAAALDALLDPGSSALFRYTIAPGETVHGVFTALSQRIGAPMEELEAIAVDPSELGLPSYATGLEGYLFPGTYDLAPGRSAVDILKEAVARFTSEAERIDLEGRAAAGNVDPGDIVIIASIIEKEVANTDEGPKAARVVYNRLNDTSGAYRRLDMDSTTRYALDEYEGPLTREQLADQNPYNTRAVPGLPPGAIANPGTWALESALVPAPGSWLYFVSMPQSKVTMFASTEEEFAVALEQYRREGGSE